MGARAVTWVGATGIDLLRNRSVNAGHSHELGIREKPLQKKTTKADNGCERVAREKRRGCVTRFQ